jgi:hypothetical protein
MIGNPEAANRLARAIASDLSLYNEPQFQEWARDGRLPTSLAEALVEGNQLFASRVDPALHEGGRFFVRSLLPIFEGVIKSKGPRPPDFQGEIERALGLTPTPTSVLYSIQELASMDQKESAALTVKVGSLMGDGTLSFFDKIFVLERTTFGDIKDRIELAYAEIEELRVARGHMGCELAVRVRFTEQKFTMSPTDAQAVAARLLPFVISSA